MNESQLLFYLGKDMLLEYDWYREMFSIPIKADNQFFTYDKEKNICIFKDIDLTIQLSKDRLTPLSLADKITLNPKALPNLDRKIDTDICDVLLNYLFIVYPFNDKIPFMESLDPLKIEGNILPYRLCVDIDTDEYGKFVESSDFIEQLSDLFVVSATIKVISPAPGIRAYKNKLYKEARELHGSHFDTNIELIAEIDSKLVAYDTEYMKDDPTYGILVDGKIMGNARKNLFGTIGGEIGLDGEVTPIIENSLLEGYPNNKEQLATIFNSSRKGSISRGFMTQYTGADAKVTARVINNVETTTGDCGTTEGIDTLITKDNFSEYINYYIMENNKTILLSKDIVEQYINKTVILRSYMKCKEPNNKYCGICSGKIGEENKHLPIILTTETSGNFTNSSMKSMHDKTLSVVDYDLEIALS